MLISDWLRKREPPPPGIEPRASRFTSEYANHYTIDARLISMLGSIDLRKKSILSGVSLQLYAPFRYVCIKREKRKSGNNKWAT